MHRTGLVLAALLLAAPGAALAADKVQIGEGKTAPESMTATSDGTLYAGSLAKGEIYKAAPGATKADKFIDKPADGPQSVLGVWADEKDGLLWACYSQFGDNAPPSIARSYDLKTGALKGSYTLGPKSVCNDFTRGTDGTIYIADTGNGGVIRLKAGSSTPESWILNDNLKGADGISFGPDGAVYVNSVFTSGLYRIPVNADGSAGTPVEIMPSEPLKGTDGMRWGDDGKLYVAENANGRIDQLTIDGDKATVKPVATGLDGPTSMTKVGNTLWVLDS
ncbi:MAG TPA: SMP-30/gluconolactonase/LRE family protein, partial [Devosia sp.]|nr:SMP-30/gluconolactonase/LRE family protein [Devosia sp.]